ncbi:lipoate-protein ligase B [Wolbachia pipientis]|uniref:Octanoyltransferase n=2 Tax=Wolbachia pipientis TaxID=955 RepID=A0A1E7QJ33_WOLPI|nr:lipoate-protein ligase B [Wolbachia pipientis]
MEARVELIHKDLAHELIWLLEHPAIYTAGISALDNEVIDALFPIYKTCRGGKYTYHGPGQRIIYLMLNLRARNQQNVRTYIKNLSNLIINVLKHFNILGEFREDRIGIWVNNNGIEEKIAAFGVRLRKWITYHGIALNVNPDLSNYKGIVPCGLQNYGVTSMDTLGVNVTLSDLDIVIRQEFYRIF